MNDQMTLDNVLDFICCSATPLQLSAIQAMMDKSGINDRAASRQEQATEVHVPNQDRHGDEHLLRPHDKNVAYRTTSNILYWSYVCALRN